MSMKKLTTKGFTLIELMIVVAIIGILAAVAIPKFADLVTKSREASVRGNLGAVRSALSIYYGDQEGFYPSNLFVGLTTGARYMPQVGGVASLGNYDIPRNSNGNPGHKHGNVSAASEVLQVPTIAASETGGEALLYVSFATAPTAGEVYINCIHTDTKNAQWTSY